MFSLNGAVKYKYIPNYQDMRGGYDKMQEAQHNHECTMKDKELGRIGLFFGTAENSSKNISALICFLLLSAIIVMSGIVYYLDKDKDFIGNLWQMILPVITLSLGYIFGKRE